MQGIESICHTILEGARKDAQDAWEAAQARVKDIETQTQDEIDRQVAQILDAAKRQGEENTRRGLVMAGLDRRRANLAMKQELMDQVFDQVLDAMCAMPAPRMTEVLLRMLAEAVDSGREEVVIGREEKVMNQAVIDHVNAQRKAAGQVGELRLASERADIRGGFLLVDAGVSTNASFEMLIRQQRTQLEREAAAILFES